MWVSQLVHRDLEYQDPAKITVAYIRSDYLVKLDDFSLIKPNEGEGYQIGVGSNFPWVHAIPRFKYIMINTVSVIRKILVFLKLTSDDRVLIGILT